jgi:hypothetical protein
MSINTLIDGENLFINKQLINKKEELINYEHLFVGRKDNLDPKGLEKYLNKDLWDEFKDDKCSLGVSFKKCVIPGIIFNNSDIILCAGSKNCYEKFHELFGPYIEDHHGLK